MRRRLVSYGNQQCSSLIDSATSTSAEPVTGQPLLPPTVFILKATFDGLEYDVYVSDADAHLATYKWRLTPGGYVYRNRSYKPQPRKGRPWRVCRRVYLHREILGLKHGHKREGDHKDCNPLNNQRENLKIVTKARNVKLSWNRTRSWEHAA